MKRSERMSDEDRSAAHAFLAAMTYQGPAPINAYGYHGITRAQWSESYQSWARGGHAWNRLEQGGTGIMAALCWYQHIHRPGSKEWRPAVIIRALVATARTAQLDNSHPARSTPEGDNTPGTPGDSQ